MSESTQDAHTDEIAIVGLACRFPQAPDAGAFWRRLRVGDECVTFLTEDELLAAGESPERIADPRYVRSPGAVLEDVDLFDAAFFGIHPQEAALMDPQHRVFLECAHDALENAGYDPTKYGGRIGLFAGVGRNHYLLENLIPQGRAMAAAGRLNATIANDKDYVPLRVSYLLNLRGPSMAVQTACSTSLVATHLACQSLLHGDCEIAMAGGVSITTLHQRGYLGTDDGIFSADGHCRPFDADASGPTAGNGAGVVVLKLLDDAIADRDTIHAVIKGSAINNDGSSKVGFAAPSVEGQRQVIHDALNIADVDARTISYVEAHGTGTPLGDMIEVAALTEAFREHTEDRGYCGLGTVKSNIGHTNTAAGVAALIKTTLALQHRTLPPSLNFARPNPEIDFEGSPFYVVSEPRPWESDGGRRRACVHAVAIGGTNAHIVLEAAPPPTPTSTTRSAHLVVLSARSDAALRHATANLVGHLRAHSELALADVAFTLQMGRRSLNHRLMVVATTLEGCVSALEAGDTERVRTAVSESSGRQVTMVFGGGRPSGGGWRALAASEPAFRDALESCAVAAGNGDIEGDPALAHFAWLYALGRLWLSFGLRPRTLLGYGVGAIVAATLDDSVDQPLSLIEAVQRAKVLGDETGSSDVARALVERTLHDDDDRLLAILAPDDAANAWRQAHPERVTAVNTDGGLDAQLEALGELWVAGAEVHWDELHRAERRQRVPLPTYPFERQRYWVEPNGDGAAGATSDDARRWLHVPSWQRTPSPRSPVAVAGGAQEAVWLVLVDQVGLGDQLAARWQEGGARVVRVAISDGFAETAADRYALRPAHHGDWRALAKRLEETGQWPTHVVHCWGVVGPGPETNPLADPDDAHERGFASLVRAAEILSGRNAALQLDVVTNDLRDVLGGEIVRAERATALGACRVLPQEHQQLTCRHIDVQLDRGGLAASAELIEQLVVECAADAVDPVVAYRGRARWVQTFTPLQPPSATVAPATSDGAVVVTGGLGRIGMALATQLVETGYRCLVLTSHTGLPARSEWPAWLERHDDTDAIAQRITAVRALEDRGAEVEVVVADATDLDATTSVVERARQRFGAVRGAVCAVGPSPGVSSARLGAKVRGTMALLHVLRGEPLEFLVLNSCITSVRGGLGAADDAGASACVEALALAASPLAPVQAVTWDLWDDDHGISVAAGQAAFAAVLAARERHVVVSRTDPLSQPVAPEPERRAHSATYTAPQGDLQCAIANIWEEILGVEKVGAKDNFFDVGGRSLTAVRVASRLREEFEVEFSLRQLFDSPTVADLAAFVEASKWVVQTDDRDQGGDRDEIEL